MELPLAVLTLIFVTTLGLLVASNALLDRMSIALVTSAAVTFLAAAALFHRMGVRRLARLEGLGREDPLTGLPNRRGFHADFERSSRNGDEIAVAVIDLDGFMHVNEQYGHNVGDRTIRECAGIMLEILKLEAQLYRLGGDEFAILMSGQVAGTLLEGMCRRLIERLAKPVEVDERRLTLGASVGLARSDGRDGLTSSEMLRRADVAMYASKRGGKSRCTWFSRDFDISREQARELDDELRDALANGEFRLAYQPLVDCHSRRITAVESLLRWERKDKAPIGPNTFIPIAEQSGLINPIGLWVLRQACLDALGWGDIILSVNISAAQLRNPEFPIQLGHILEETGFPPKRLELEITETCLVFDPVIAERSLDVIRGFGVNVALDDFGTGYASIGFLRQFRFEKLKLDRSLVVDAGTDQGSRAMMLSSITVARALNMGVTAEGVETTEQADMVRAAGCDQIQGWLYFRAMPADEIEQYLGKVIELPIATSKPAITGGGVQAA